MKRRVLIVDDDYFMKRMLGALFCEMGCEVTTVGEGSEGLTLIEEDCFDLALLDYHIPGSSPAEIVARMQERAIGTPVVIVTADDSVETERAARALGVAYYFVKPFSIDDLRAVAERIFLSASSRGPAERHFDTAAAHSSDHSFQGRN